MLSSLSPPHIPHIPYSRFLPYIICTAAVLLAYANVYNNAFFYDDDFLIVQNQFLRSWRNLSTLFMTPLAAGSNTDSAYYRPLQALIYMVIFQTAGLSTVAFHAVNVVLHAANACLVYRLGQKMGFKPAAVFLAALLWALHPIHTEAVTYMSATADTLYSFFCLLGIVILLPDFSIRRILTALPFVLLALLSKEEAVTFPLLAMSCLYFVSPRRLNPKIYLRLSPLGLLVIAYAILHFALPLHGLIPDAAHTPHIPPSPISGFVPFATMPTYLRLLVWPTGLHMEHDFHDVTDFWNPQILAGFALIVAASLQIIKPQTTRSLPFSWGLLWFIAADLIVFYADDIAYEHWMYLPSAGLFLGLAQTIALHIEKLSPRRLGWIGSAGTALALGGASLFGFLTYQQNTIWRDPITFYTNIIGAGELGAKAHTNLGSYYANNHQPQQALAEYHLALQNSDDGIAAVHNNIALTLLDLRDGKDHTAEALTHFNRALELDPNYLPTLTALARFYTKTGDDAKAALYQNRANALHQQFMTPLNPATP